MMLEERGLLGTVDPRVKLCWVLATMVAGLVFVDVSSLVVILSSIALVVAAGGVLGATIRRLRGLAIVMVMLGLIMGLMIPGEPLVSFGPLAVSREGLGLGTVSILRMLIFATPLVVVTITTTSSHLIEGLIAFKLPLEYALMMVLALNIVPVYLEELWRIVDAQKARAHALVDQGPIGKVRGLVPIFVPLTLNAIDRADTMGKVLEVRGVTRGRFRPEPEPITAAGWALLAVSILIAGLAVGPSPGAGTSS